jgi:hypothetical protein
MDPRLRGDDKGGGSGTKMDPRLHGDDKGTAVAGLLVNLLSACSLGLQAIGLWASAGLCHAESQLKLRLQRTSPALLQPCDKADEACVSAHFVLDSGAGRGTHPVQSVSAWLVAQDGSIVWQQGKSPWLKEWPSCDE